MTFWGATVAVLIVLILLLITSNATAGIVPDDHDALARTTSLGKLIQTVRDRPVHIVYVHGMRADGVGASEAFRAGLCRYIPELCSGDVRPEFHREFLPWGSLPSALYLGAPVWKTEAEWQASRPFVDRYVFRRPGAEPVIVDEVNWWTLLFPPKCRLLLVPEIDLSGADRDHLQLCANSTAPYHAWLSPEEVSKFLAQKPKSGGGAYLNRYLKQQIMNWGMADAVLALGPLREYFRKTINSAFEYASDFDKRDIMGQEFVVISESLGSFVVLDAFDNLFKDSNTAQQIGDQVIDLYFFANQFALLELGRFDLGQKPASAQGDAESLTEPQTSPTDLLRRWAARSRLLEFAGRPKQIIAFSDPNDALTCVVPKLIDPKSGAELAIVVNAYDRNEINWLGLVASPIKAHTGHSGNRQVLKLMLNVK